MFCCFLFFCCVLLSVCYYFIFVLDSILVILLGIFFFFNQKTAYEWLISDWSSDVCSSDLAVAGWLSRKHFAVGVVFLLVLVTLAGAAALSRPLATLEDLIPAVVTAIVGLAVLFLLVRHPSPKRMRHPMRQAELANQPMSRRMVLIASGVVASITGLMAWGGERIIARRTSPASIAMPPPADQAPPLPRGLAQSYRGIRRLHSPHGT